MELLKGVLHAPLLPSVGVPWACRVCWMGERQEPCVPETEAAVGGEGERQVVGRRQS